MTVTVDDDFARFGSKSYAINKINSVEVRERKPYGMGAVILFGILAAFCLIAALGTLASPVPSPGSYLVIGAIFGALAYWQWRKTRIREYSLFVMTSSSEAQAFVTRDQGEVFTLRDRIESAMTRRSRTGSDR